MLHIYFREWCYTKIRVREEVRKEKEDGKYKILRKFQKFRKKGEVESKIKILAYFYDSYHVVILQMRSSPVNKLRIIAEIKDMRNQPYPR